MAKDLGSARRVLEAAFGLDEPPEELSVSLDANGGAAQTQYSRIDSALDLKAADERTLGTMESAAVAAVPGD